MFKINAVFLSLFFFIAANFSSLEAQSDSVQLNDNVIPTSVVKKLSYENFRNIKLLRSAILNYGGGDAEVQKLIDQYADASALYFQDKIVESAKKYLENEREIFRVAKKIAKTYRDDSTGFLRKGIKRNIKISLEREVSGKHSDAVMAKYLNNAKFAFKKANSIYDDFKYVNENKPSPAYKLITSIYYYRLSKKNLFLMYKAYGLTLNLDKDKKKNDKKVEEKIEQMIKEDYKPDYKKDLKDNENKVYTSKEKTI